MPIMTPCAVSEGLSNETVTTETAALGFGSRFRLPGKRLLLLRSFFEAQQPLSAPQFADVQVEKKKKFTKNSHFTLASGYQTSAASEGSDSKPFILYWNFHFALLPVNFHC